MELVRKMLFMNNKKGIVLVLLREKLCVVL
ncbi:hypothetical protein K737_300017 [Holospora undulata HU1]|uniref:Uncharacterized protein n=1 Tax=Holospora undulata HU1 TaxID=1321371 RepID=A0A061JJ18_9PROT|nr:hypothetical protein K737_300017 [Holospora undulata HU1]